MTAVAKMFCIIGSINVGLAVLMGAFGAHGLKEKISERMLDVFHTGVAYHMYHALGLFAVAFVAQHVNHGMVRWSGWLMLAGIILFSGSLYLLSLSGIKWLGAITPVGGTLFIVAWGLLAAALFKS